MGAITRGQADWSKVNGYEYSKLIDTVLLVMELRQDEWLPVGILKHSLNFGAGMSKSWDIAMPASNLATSINS